MKINGIVCALGLASMANANNQVMMQKMPVMSYEVSAIDNYLTFQKNEVGKITNPGCEDMCWQGYLNACALCSAAFVSPPIYWACVGAAFGAYMGCMAGCRG